MRRVCWACSLAFVLGAPGVGQVNDIRGTVVDPGDGVIPNATVTLRATGGGGLQSTTTTDEVGRFQFAAITPGLYEIQISIAGFVTRTLAVTVVEGRNTELARIPLSLAAIPACPEDVGPPRVDLETIGGTKTAVGGKVIDVGETKAPLPGVTVLLTEIGGRSNSISTRTDDLGNFLFRGISPGSYSLRTLRQGYSEFVIRRIEVKAGHRTIIRDDLETSKCPAGTRCKPIRNVHRTELCL